MIHAANAVMRALADAAAITVIDKCFFKKRRHGVKNKMMHDAIAEIGGKDFTFYRFVDDKTDAFARFIGSVDNLLGQLKNITFKVLFKSQRIDGVALVAAGVKIRLKQIR